MGNLNPLKFCFQCHRSKARTTFRTLPGDPCKRQLCAECYELAVAAQNRKRQSMGAGLRGVTGVGRGSR